MKDAARSPRLALVSGREALAVDLDVPGWRRGGACLALASGAQVEIDLAGAA